MTGTEVERIDQLMDELKVKRREAAKRERERERRKEERRRKVIGQVCMEHGNDALMAQIYGLLKKHAPVSDFPLWPDLFPEQAAASSKKKARSKTASSPETPTPNESEAVTGDLEAEDCEPIEVAWDPQARD